MRIDPMRPQQALLIRPWTRSRIVARFTVPVRAGQSGSPLLNAEGDVVGVVPYVSPTESATASPVAVIQRIMANAGTNSPTSLTWTRICNDH